MAGRILVVDDESTTRRLVHFILKPMGVEVLEAGDSQAALEMVQTVVPDLILVDLNLPAVDGFTLIEQMRRLDHLAQVPLIVFTARNRRDDEDRARALGTSGFLNKPFSTQELRSLVAQYVNGV
jgi:CheY-like chemotaxis protein